MGEVLFQVSYEQEGPLQKTITTSRPELLSVIIINGEEEASVLSSALQGEELNLQDSLLPITESRNGSVYSATFHLLSSGIGVQVLLLPVAFATLGWAWGITCLSLGFFWQLYTIWLLVHLHESRPGVRYSRFLQLSMASFGEKLGKLTALFPVMYLSGGTCVTMIITGGGAMELFFNTICYGDDGRAGFGGKPPSSAEWFLVFICLAMSMAQFPNLNSISRVSLLGAVTAVGYCSLIWVLSISKGRPSGVTYDPPPATNWVAQISDVVNAIGIILLTFRGHNVVLEIQVVGFPYWWQGTLPTNPKHPSKRTMWTAVMTSYLLIAVLCVFPIAIGGHWAFGGEIPKNGGILRAISQTGKLTSSKPIIGMIYLLIVINSLTTYQIYAMIVFDTLESKYTSRKKKPCPWWLRLGSRMFFGGLTYLIAVAFPFLPSLAFFLGGLAMPLTLAYPCFMWIAIKKKPSSGSAIRPLNLLLGCSGLIISVLIVAAAAWNLGRDGLEANFFNP